MSTLYGVDRIYSWLFSIVFALKLAGPSHWISPTTISLDSFILQIKRVDSHARIFHNNLIIAEKMAGTIYAENI
jgi:hypothetical protein